MNKIVLPIQNIDQEIRKAQQYLTLLKEINLQKVAISKELPPRYTAEQVAGMYSVVPSTVQRWIKEGHLGALDLTPEGSRRRIYAVRPEDLEAFEAIRHTIKPGRKATKKK